MTATEAQRRLKAVGMTYCGHRWSADLILGEDTRLLAHEAMTRGRAGVNSIAVVAWGKTAEEARENLVRYCERGG